MPGVPQIPILKSAWTLLPFIGTTNLLRFHEAAFQRYKTYGKILWEAFRDRRLVWVFDANDAEVVFRHEGKYPMREGFEAMALYRKMRPQYYGSTGLLLVHGKEWYNFRSKTQTYLLRPKLVHQYLPIMNEIANEMIERIHSIRSRSDSSIDDFVKELYRYALETIGLIALDCRLGSLKKDETDSSSDAQIIIKCANDILMLNSLLDSQILAMWRLLGRPVGKIWSKFIEANDQFTQICFRYIEKTKNRVKEVKTEQNQDASILQLLLMRPDFTPSEAVTMILDMFLAGIDTTSHSTAYTLYFLAKHKDVQAQAREEIKRVVGKSPVISEEMIADLQYLKACIKESQRLNPVVFANERTLSEDIVLSGYRVPAGTMIVIGHYVMSRLEEYFPDPFSYKPERWLRKVNSVSANKRSYKEDIHPFAVLPFGFGPRMCIGRRIAMQEMLLFLSKILQNFEVDYEGDELRMINRTVTCPEKPLRFKFFKL
ncbi:putative cytochrome P450 301a1-like protein [Dinothrombium tinctorium]|uniref:Putative cytochrome P450 301a1-like protein n=1 Tax=Dinothrombium tinctorium TaxID=1965070 RepID=A0A3S3RTF4_9ACAR|nr:putative cytochrome P450 301a1-like protein [Dinothrombium tinctorium]RWS04471.1 putative cytochrome P450 301a1-like protein [Dinothrombium tinctorium]